MLALDCAAQARGLGGQWEAGLLGAERSALEDARFVAAFVAFPAARAGFAFRAVFALAGGFEYRIVFPDDDSAGSVFAQESFDLYLFGDLVGGHLIESEFLPDDLFVGVVVGFQDLHLFFELAAEFADHFFGLVDDDGEAVDAFHFRWGGVEAFDVYLPFGEQDGDPVDEADLVFRVDGYCILLFLHEL